MYTEKSKGIFNKTKFLQQTLPLQEILQQNLILSQAVIPPPPTQPKETFDKMILTFYKMILYK